METLCIRYGHPLWEKTIAFARDSSWRAGPVLAERMERNGFQDWERVIAAAENGSVVGYCTFTEQDELPEAYGYSPFIGFVFVDEQHRGRRLSQGMIQYAMAYLKSVGFDQVYLVSDHENLYEKYGFLKIGDYETIYGTADQLFQRNC